MDHSGKCQITPRKTTIGKPYNSAVLNDKKKVSENITFRKGLGTRLKATRK